MPPLRASCMLPLQGIHQGRTPRLPEDTHSEESHACLHIPGVSFPVCLCTQWACGSVCSCMDCIMYVKHSEQSGWHVPSM